MSTSTQSVRRSIKKSIETVFVRAYLSSGQNDLTGNAFNKILFNAVDDDNGSNFDTTNHKFTAPVTGLYEITASVEFTSVVSAKRYIVAIYQNGVLIRSTSVHASLVANLTGRVNETLFLLADDTIEVYAEPEVGGGTDTVDVVGTLTGSILQIRLATKEGIRQ